MKPTAKETDPEPRAQGPKPQGGPAAGGRRPSRRSRGEGKEPPSTQTRVQTYCYRQAAPWRIASAKGVACLFGRAALVSANIKHHEDQRRHFFGQNVSMFIAVFCRRMLTH